MKIDVDENVIVRVCDAALRANGINALQDVTLITTAVIRAKANSENELAVKVKEAKETKDAPKANDTSMAK